mgnify:FL=1|tara:strand:+ start:378 stop:578 length:201 start_codon:yes stop_codon:yes gene_type:complete
MGFRASTANIKNPQKSPKPDKNQLSGEEIEVLIKMVHDSTFQGKDIESLYNLVIKLQNQYKTFQSK